MKWALLFLLSLSSVTARAQEFKAQLTRDPELMMPGLTWEKESQNPAIQVREGEDGSPESWVQLRGHYSLTQNSLVNALENEKQKISLQVDGSFQLEMQIQGEVTELVLIAIEESGQVTLETLQLSFPQLKELQRSFTEEKIAAISLGVGGTYGTYQQTNVTTLSEILITAKVGGEYRILPQWDLGVGAYYAVLPLSSSVSGRSLTFLGMNGRVGWRVQGIAAPWSLSLMGGIYYATTFSKGAEFGYRNLQGVQFYPVVRREFAHHHLAWAYFKYSPIFDGSSFLAWNNAEFALGGGYTVMRFLDQSSIAVTLDLALLKLQASATSEFQSNTYSVGVAYRFAP